MGIGLDGNRRRKCTCVGELWDIDEERVVVVVEVGVYL